MEFIQLPQGNNQEIYINPEELDIKPEWINQEIHAIIMPDLPINQSNPVYEAYKSLFKELYEKGYNIVTDSRTTSNDAFFFTPCLDKHINATKENYDINKKKKIEFCLMNEGITEPFSVSFPVDSVPDILPSLPLVLKNEEAQGGEEKFIIKRFYNEIDHYARQKAIDEVKREYSFLGDLKFDEKGHSNKIISINFINYKDEFHKNMRFQKFVKTPTKYNTSLRVLTSSSGDILAASLKFSETSSRAFPILFFDLCFFN